MSQPASASSRNSTPRRSESPVDQAVMQLTHKAFQVIKEYTSGSLALDRVQLEWKMLQSLLAKLGYKAVLLKGDSPDQVCVNVLRATAVSAFLFSAQVFCHLCERQAEKICCGRHWCLECHQAHRKEEHYDR